MPRFFHRKKRPLRPLYTCESRLMEEKTFFSYNLWIFRRKKNNRWQKMPRFMQKGYVSFWKKTFFPKLPCTIVQKNLFLGKFYVFFVRKKPFFPLSPYVAKRKEPQKFHILFHISLSLSSSASNQASLASSLARIGVYISCKNLKF